MYLEQASGSLRVGVARGLKSGEVADSLEVVLAVTLRPRRALSILVDFDVCVRALRAMSAEF